MQSARSVLFPTNNIQQCNVTIVRLFDKLRYFHSDCVCVCTSFCCFFFHHLIIQYTILVFRLICPECFKWSSISAVWPLSLSVLNQLSMACYCKLHPYTIHTHTHILFEQREKNSWANIFVKKVELHRQSRSGLSCRRWCKWTLLVANGLVLVAFKDIETTKSKKKKKHWNQFVEPVWTLNPWWTYKMYEKIMMCVHLIGKTANVPRSKIWPQKHRVCNRQAIGAKCLSNVP